MKYGIANLQLFKERFYSPYRNLIFFSLSRLINVNKTYEKKAATFFNVFHAYLQRHGVIVSTLFLGCFVFFFIFVRILYVKIIGKCVKNIYPCVQVKFSFCSSCISLFLIRIAATTGLHSIIINTEIIKFITRSYCARVHSVCTRLDRLASVDRQRKLECASCMQRVSANANDANRCAIARHTLSTHVLLSSVVLTAVAAVCMHFSCFSTLARAVSFLLRYCSYRCICMHAL